MALSPANGAALGSAIASALGVVDAPSIAKWQLIGQAIYSHLLTDAVITVTSVTAVTPGGGVSGPGTGTLT